jgi:proton-translocating NAD(P)+ transhydrogenase subunit alpha
MDNNPMQIGILKCTIDPMVAIIPSVATKLIKEGHKVRVEKGAGEQALYEDHQFESAGVIIASRDEILRSSDLILTVSGVFKEDLEKAKKNTILIGKFNPKIETEWAHLLAKSGLKVFSLDLVPRSSIAQSMDVISSLSSLAGYKAVISAADRYCGYFPMMTTPAGTFPPARVLVIGAGVAGLQAIATAKRLGAEVEAFDVREAVKEEVESLGARFIQVEGSQEDRKLGGYAMQQTEDYVKRQQEVIHEHSSKSDVIICTANIPGRKAPLLVRENTLKEMKQGSIIVDLAAETGGNCELTKNGKEIKAHGVTIYGNSKLYALLPKKASKLYANNVFNFVKFMLKYGSGNLDHDILVKTQVAMGPSPQ